MTNAQKRSADKIVNAYREKDGKADNINGFLGNLQTPETPLDALRYASHILLSKGILVSAFGSVDRENLMLSDKGWEYDSYEKLIQEEKRKRALEDALISSSIAANKSVYYVNKLFWITAIFALLSAVGTVGSFVIELKRELHKPLPRAGLR